MEESNVPQFDAATSPGPGWYYRITYDEQGEEVGLEHLYAMTPWEMHDIAKARLDLEKAILTLEAIIAEQREQHELQQYEMRWEEIRNDTETEG